MSRKEILKVFKSLHRATQETFQGDKRAINEARQRINLEFRQAADKEEIKEKLQRSKEVELILKHQVVQAVKNPETDNYGK